MRLQVEYKFKPEILYLLRPGIRPAARWHFTSGLASEIINDATSIADRAALGYAFSRHGFSFRYFANIDVKSIPFHGYLIPRKYFVRGFISADLTRRI